MVGVPFLIVPILAYSVARNREGLTNLPVKIILYVTFLLQMICEIRASTDSLAKYPILFPIFFIDR
jgi:hypothetical protein